MDKNFLVAVGAVIVGIAVYDWLVKPVLAPFTTRA
jgi:hypothetical protein